MLEMLRQMREKHEIDAHRREVVFFADHGIVAHPDLASWVLATACSGRSMGPFEVRVLQWGRLLVYGGLGVAVFAGCVSDDPERVVRWIGEREVGAVGYLREKFRLGMGDGTDDEEDDGDLFFTQAMAMSRRLAVPTGKAISRVAGLVDECEIPVPEGRVMIQAGSCLDAVDPRCIGMLGRTTSTRVLRAHAALARLCRLLGPAPAQGAG